MNMRAFAVAACLAASMLYSIPMAMAASRAPGFQRRTTAEMLAGTLALARQQVRIADYRMTGRVVRVDADGKRTSYSVRMQAHWFPGVLRVRLDVTAPAAAREQVLLEMRPGGKDTILIAHPGDARAVALPFAQWGAGPFGARPGAGFSYEDFLNAQYFWSGQKDMGEVQYGARNCDLLLSTPGATDKSGYAAVKSWLDAASGFPVYVEKTRKGSGEIKQFTSFGLRRTEGVWWAGQVEVKTRGQAGSMLLIVDRGAARAHLDLKDFSAAQLTHF